tara:strand:- start:205 stop:432 length:228 start_codon:yes stop_codon:yes gene_type:complete
MALSEILELGLTTIQTKVAYLSSVILGSVSVLALQEIISILGVLISIVIALVASYYNHKRHKLQMRLLRKQLSKH